MGNDTVLDGSMSTFLCVNLWIWAVLGVLGVFTIIYQIGKPRTPRTPGEVVISIIIFCWQAWMVYSLIQVK